MGIQWFPGHMTKARRAIIEELPLQDVVIEVLDARIPRASENPLLAELRGNKPCIKILNKSDLADEDITQEWIAFFANSSLPAGAGRVVAIALSSNKVAKMKERLFALCKDLSPHPSGPGKTVRAMILGVPNVGKSTLINSLMERKVAAVSDRPAVTKSIQRVILKNGMMLTDNPGMMWPKIEDDSASLRLALCGSIPETAVDNEIVATFAADWLLDNAMDRLVARYKLKDEPKVAADLLREIGKRRGGLRAGGTVDMHKAASVLITDFRQGALGRVTLERPRMAAPEME